MLSSNEMKLGVQKDDPYYVDPKWVNTSLEEIRALFGMNVMMMSQIIDRYSSQTLTKRDCNDLQKNSTQHEKKFQTL